MAFSKENEEFFHRLCSIKFPRNQDVYLEAVALQNKCAHLLENASIESMAKNEVERCFSQYSEIVDQMDGTGLNNYAEGALALCSHHKNESSKWKTNLSLCSILKACKFEDSDDCDLEKTDGKDADPVITIQDKKEKPSSFPKGEEADMKKISNTFDQRNPLVHGKSQPNATFNADQSKNFAASATDGAKYSDFNHSNIHGREYHEKDLFPPCRDKIFETSTKPSSPSLFKTTNSLQSNVNQRSNMNDSSAISNSRSAYSHNMNVQNSRSVFSHNMNESSSISNSSSAYVSSVNYKKESNFGSKTSVSNNLTVNPQKMGGPYSNFGQKRKVADQPWKKGKWNQGQSSYEDDMEDGEEDMNQNNKYQSNPFRTAKEQLVIDKQKKNQDSNRGAPTSTSYGSVKRSLGTRRGPAGKFIPPVLNKEFDDNDSSGGDSFNKGQRSACGRGQGEGSPPDEFEDERLKGIDPKMIELITNEIMDHGTPITWDDIAGLDFAKKTIKEIVVWPMLRPDIFTGLRGPPKGLLLFGPPGTGKTLIGKCIASQSKSTFFCISASSLTSKWVGEGEKMVKALFAVARVNQPAVIFIDEIDSLLSQRSDNEHESSRRIKTEFLVQLDGAATGSEDRILVIGATNRPQEIDEAARRRFVKRLLIPLPEAVARRQIVCHLMAKQNSDLSEAEIQAITDRSDGYSGADMTNLCREAALGPIRSIPFEEIETITAEQVRPISFEDFQGALLQVRASVSSKDLQLYKEWNQTYGSFGM